MSLVASVIELIRPRAGSMGSFSGEFHTRKSLRPDGAPSSVTSSTSCVKVSKLLLGTREKHSTITYIDTENILHVLPRLRDSRTASNKSGPAICTHTLSKTAEDTLNSLRTSHRGADSPQATHYLRYMAI